MIKIDRRDFLKSCMYAPIIASFACSDNKNKQIKNKESENIVQKVKETKISEQLFVESNPRLKQSFSKKYCYMLVHPGFADYRESLYYKILINIDQNFPMYGDYNNYLNNISKLIQYLNNSDELAIFAIEEKDFYNKDIPKKELRPGNSSMIIVTENTGVKPIKYVKTENGSEMQGLDSLSRVLLFLKINDVEEIRFAGEWARGGERESPEDEEAGCLRSLASIFYNVFYFDIKGIEGCIYPSIRNQYDKPKKKDSILEKLYNNQIPLDAIIK